MTTKDDLDNIDYTEANKAAGGDCYHKTPEYLRSDDFKFSHLG